MLLSEFATGINVAIALFTIGHFAVRADAVGRFFPGERTEHAALEEILLQSSPDDPVPVCILPDTTGAVADAHPRRRVRVVEINPPVLRVIGHHGINRGGGFKLLCAVLLNRQDKFAPCFAAVRTASDNLIDPVGIIHSGTVPRIRARDHRTVLRCHHGRDPVVIGRSSQPGAKNCLKLHWSLLIPPEGQAV